MPGEGRGGGRRESSSLGSRAAIPSAFILFPWPGWKKLVQSGTSAPLPHHLRAAVAGAAGKAVGTGCRMAQSGSEGRCLPLPTAKLQGAERLGHTPTGSLQIGVALTVGPIAHSLPPC